MNYNEEIIPTTVLHWNYRGFTEFPLNQLKGEEAEVTDIYLKENLLTRLPTNIGIFEHLESLYVSGNDITELPREISKLRCLKCLDVSGNRLRRIPEEIAEARSLKFLILDENELTELPLRISELRRLRYLSVCDNKLQWLPQRPVYNYHHCEFRFWRNSNLKTLPYSLWYHMFRDQQTRCLNIGCLNTANSQNTNKTNRHCKLKFSQDSKEYEVTVEWPPQYNVILDSKFYSPPSLYEMCRREFYEMINAAVKKLNPQTYSFYSEHVRENLYNEHNNNIIDLQENFHGFNIDSREGNTYSDENGNNYRSVLIKEGNNKKVTKPYFVPADIIKEYFNFLPNFIKSDLSNGPVSRCENLNCKKSVFDHVFYEFCFGKSTTETETDKKEEPKVEHVTSHGYFHGHECRLKREQLSAYDIKSRGLSRMIFNLITVQSGDIRAINMYRSYAALCAEKYRHHNHFRFTVHPYSKLRVFLEKVFVFFMICSSIILPIHYGGINPAEHDMHLRAHIFCDIVVIINIIANFITGYVEGHSHKVAVLALNKIGYRYIRTWLVVDVLSSIGFMLEFFEVDSITPRLTLDSMKLLRLPVILIYTHNILTVMRATTYQRTAVDILFFLVMYLSWNIYFQFAVDYLIEGSYTPENPRNCSWLSVGKLWNQTTRVRMLYAFDRAVGMLTTNTNMNLLEQTMGCFQNFLIVGWLLSKIFVFHYGIKYMLAIFGKESARANYYIMKKQLKTYMAQRNFPPRLKSKILKFYAIRFQSKYFAESRMLECVSGQLREDILMHTGRQLVRELEFLKHLPSSLLVQIAFKLRVVIYIAGDIIFKINTVGDCLYFIDRGTVAIYSDSAKEICHLEDGDFFGEIALVMKHHFRTASAIAVTNCELFRLDREHFESTIGYYPTVYENIKEVATNRFERTCVLDEHHKAELKTVEAFVTS